MDASEVIHRACHRDDPVLDLVAEQTRQGEVAEVVGAHMCLEAVGGAGQRQSHHAGVVHQHINGFHRVSECAHTGEIGEIEFRNLDAARHIGGCPLGLLDASAGDHHAVATLGCRGSGRLADTAVAAGDDDPHQRGAYMIRPTLSQPARATTFVRDFQACPRTNAVGRGQEELRFHSTQPTPVRLSSVVTVAHAREKWLIRPSGEVNSTGACPRMSMVAVRSP